MEMNTKKTWKMTWKTAILILVATLYGGALAAQEEPAGAPDGIFGEVIDVRVVNLEVVVTDKDGERVRGLRPEDFVLTVDGQEVPIEYFTEIEGGAAVASADAGSTAAVPALRPGQAVGTSFLVFVDDYFPLKIDRDRVLDRLIEQLPLLGPEDRMAIVAFDGRRLEMLANWSRSPGELERALVAAKGRPAYGLQEEARRHAFRSIRQRDLGDGRFTNPRRFADAEDRFQVDALADRLERMSLGVVAALRSFANPPGRKALILLAGGWPDNPVDAVTPTPDFALLSDSLGYVDHIWRPIHDTANRLSYTLYTVDVRGFRPGAVSSAEYASLGEAAYERAVAQDREWAEHATLVGLARETGGQALLNGKNREVFEAVWRDTRSYYWLGFTPVWRGEDRRHRVHLEPRDPKLKLRGRRSFSDLSRATEVTMMVESALLFGDAPGDAGLAAALGTAEKAGLRKIHVPLEVGVPLDAVTLVETADGLAGELEVRIAVEDKNGDRNEIAVVPLELGYDEAPEKGQLALWRTTLLMRKMRHDIVVSVYDKPSGQMLWKRLHFDPETL